MDLRRVRYFVVAARAGSLASAARLSGKGSGTILAQLARLEQEVGVPLFASLTASRLELTTAGRGYLNDCERILGDLDGARTIAHGIAEGRSGTLRLGLCEDAAAPWLTTAIQSFTASYPEFALELRELSSLELATAVRRNEIDLALLLPEVDRHELTLSHLWEDDWSVVAPPGFRPLPDRPLRPCDLAHDPLVLCHPSLAPAGHDRIREAFREACIIPHIAALCLGRSTMLALGMIDVGLTFVPASMWRRWGHAGVSQVRPFVAPALRIAAAYRVIDPAGSAMRFLRTLQDATARRDQEPD